MSHNQILKNRYGQHFTIQPNSLTIPKTVECENFWSPLYTKQFIQNLDAPVSFWRKTLQQIGSTVLTSFKLSDNEIEDALIKLFMQGQLKAYSVSVPNPAEHPPEKRVIKSDEANYSFALANSLLISTPKEMKNFQSAQEVIEFLTGLSPDKEQLISLTIELDIGLTITAGMDTTEIISAISEAIFAGKVVIAVDKTSSAPAEKEVVDVKNDIGNRKAGLGAGAGAAGAGAVVTEESVAKETKPPCTLEQVSIKCSHGRNIGITKKTELTPELSVIATESKEKGFDLITAEIHASELCSSHKNSSFKISKEHKLKSKSDTKIEFKVSCDSWNMSNIFERIWLPSVKPKTYNISIKDTCEAPDIKVKNANINVYPDMKWHWSTTINFGKLEFVPGKAKIKYSDFAIDGNAVLTYDGEEYDAKEKYKEYIKKPLDGFKKICDSIGKVLETINDPKAALMRIGTNTNTPPPKKGKDNKDGNETRLIIDWPKLTIDYDSTLIENDSLTYVDHDYSIKLKAKPLLEIDIQVDVLDSMMSLAPAPVAALMRYAKKRVEEDFKEGQEVGLRGELDIIFTVKSTVNINESEIKGRHNIAENDVTVKPVKGDIKIPAKLKGAIKAEGKWFYISFTVDYKMKGETEWSGDFEFGSDDTGIYFSNTVEFKGIDITLTKYEEVKAQIESEKDIVDDEYALEESTEFDNAEASLSLKDGQIKGEATVKTEEEKRWSWLKPKEDTDKQQPIKHYIVKR